MKRGFVPAIKPHGQNVIRVSNEHTHVSRTTLVGYPGTKTDGRSPDGTIAPLGSVGIYRFLSLKMRAVL